MVIRMVIQTIEPYPAGSDQIDAVSHVSRDDPSPSDVSDCEVPPRNRKVVGSNPTSGSICAGQGPNGRSGCSYACSFDHPLHAEA
jgi:hypothetical protein